MINSFQIMGDLIRLYKFIKVRKAPHKAANSHYSTSNTMDFTLCHRFDTVTNPLHSGSRTLTQGMGSYLDHIFGLIDVYSTHFQFFSNFKCFREIICKTED